MFEWNKIESDLKGDNDIELITGAPDFDANVSYEDDDKSDKEPRNTNRDAAERENEAIDYNEGTDNEIDTDFASSSQRNDQAPRCRGDDAVRDCPNNPHKQICESQFCDDVNDCPSGEDEDPERCRRGENTANFLNNRNILSILVDTKLSYFSNFISTKLHF